MRTLAVKLALHADLADRRSRRAIRRRRIYHQGQVDLLTPIVKAYCADQAFRIAELAIQTYGGAGFVEDNPVEQYCRDAKIFSIYEGTNHIQALDLVARKLQAARRRELPPRSSGRSPSSSPPTTSEPGIGDEVRALGEAADALQRARRTRLMEFFMGGKIDQVTLVANPFLEMMAEVTIAHLLLEAARRRRRASAARRATTRAHEDYDFYSGKVMAGEVLRELHPARRPRQGRDHRRRRPQRARHPRRRLLDRLLGGEPS